MDSSKHRKYAQIVERQDFKRLTRLRNSLGLVLATGMAVIYFAFIFLVAFSPSTLARPISEGSAISIGIVVGVAIMALGFVLTAIYVVVATTCLDPLVEKISGENQ